MPPGEATGARASIVERADALLALGAPVAIDIPIGLAAVPEDGPRAADGAARAYLSEQNVNGVRGVGSRVFASPTRAHLAVLRAGGTYADLRAAFPLGQGISKQCFNICPKIIELDDLCRAHPEAKIREAHPEVTFAQLAGETLQSKKSPTGAEARRSLLTALGFNLEALAAQLPVGRKLWAMDDLLDACALAMTATRIAHGTHAILPSDAGRDGLGVPSAIHC